MYFDTKKSENKADNIVSNLARTREKINFKNVIRYIEKLILSRRIA